jgi:hypothetical protein
MQDMQKWYLARSEEQAVLFTEMLERTEIFLKDVRFQQDHEAADQQKAYYKDLFLNWAKENEAE